MKVAAVKAPGGLDKIAIETRPDPVAAPGEVLVRVHASSLNFHDYAVATVIATSSSAAKLERLKDLGADHLINYKDEPEWGRAASAWTDRRGVDVVVEIGGAGTMNQSINAARLGGHISLIGVLAGWSGEVATAAAMGKNLTIKGISVGSRQEQEEMIAAIDATGIRPVIDSTYPLEGIADAFAHQIAQKHFGKICLAF